MWSQFYFNKKYEGIFISYIKGLASLLKILLKYYLILLQIMN